MAIYKLGDICNIRRGNIINEIYIKKNKGLYPVISSNTQNNGIFGHINSYMFDGEYVTMSADGAYAGSVFFQQNKFSITNVCFIFLPFENQNIFIAKYLYYFMKKTESKNQKLSIVGSSRPAVRGYFIKEIEVDLPSIEIQKQIIDIIEPIENIINNLNQLKNKIIFYINAIPFTKSDLMNKYVIFDKGQTNNSSDVYEKNDESKINFINVRYLSQGKPNKFIDANKYQKNVELGDVILTLDASIGISSIDIEGFNGYCYNLKPNDNSIIKAQIYASILKKENKFIIDQYSFGTTIKHASKAIPFIKLYFYDEVHLKLLNDLYLNLIKINLLIRKSNVLLASLISYFIK